MNNAVRARAILIMVAQTAAALLIGQSFTGCQSTVSQNPTIAVRAHANPAFVQRRAAGGPANPARFVLAAGQHYSTDGTSKSEEVDFAAVAKRIGADLNRTDFAPAAGIKNADLVIVVHWGVVAPERSAADDFLYDPDSIRQASDTLAAAQEQEKTDPVARSLGVAAAAEANLRSEIGRADSLYGDDTRRATQQADMLGFREELASRRSDPAALEVIQAMLGERRYFVGLMAYDAKVPPGKARVLLWSARMSVSAIGQSFIAAMQQMGNVAAPVLGTDQPKLLIEPVETTPAPISGRVRAGSAPRLALVR